MDTPGPATAYHSPEMSNAYERMLAGSSVQRSWLTLPTGRVHLLTKGSGPTVVMLHPRATRPDTSCRC